MQEEIWKDIPDYEGLYQVSNLGNVRSLDRLVKNNRATFIRKGKVLKFNVSGCNYKKVGIGSGSKYKKVRVHKLVAQAFLNHKKDDGYVVDHINGDKYDNRLENLQLITQRENTSKDKKNGTSKYTGVSWCSYMKRWKSGIKINGKQKHLGYYEDELEASKAYQNKLKLLMQESRQTNLKE